VGKSWTISIGGRVLPGSQTRVGIARSPARVLPPFLHAFLGSHSLRANPRSLATQFIALVCNGSGVFAPGVPPTDDMQSQIWGREMVGG
jgi:hypothetical protein